MTIVMLMRFRNTISRLGRIPSLTTSRTLITQRIRNSFSCTFSGADIFWMMLKRCCKRSFERLTMSAFETAACVSLADRYRARSTAMAA